VPQFEIVNGLDYFCSKIACPGAKIAKLTGLISITLGFYLLAVRDVMFFNHYLPREINKDNAKSETENRYFFDTFIQLLGIPVGLFREVFYQKDRPEYMNYGALGTVIAHEMYHIITQAEYRGLQGELRSWWSSHSLLNYEVKLQCLSNHYGKFVVKMIEQHVSLTHSLNFAKEKQLCM
jgi:hypothetical protein